MFQINPRQFVLFQCRRPVFVQQRFNAAAIVSISENTGECNGNGSHAPVAVLDKGVETIRNITLISKICRDSGESIYQMTFPQVLQLINGQGIIRKERADNIPNITARLARVSDQSKRLLPVQSCRKKPRHPGRTHMACAEHSDSKLILFFQFWPAGDVSMIFRK